MKLGIFDSGLGGLLITKAVQEKMPDLDIVYFGDTLRLPYGNRSDEAIYRFTKRAIDFLFAQDCSLIVIACNTASATALRRLQQEYLPGAYPGRNVLGVIVPTLEVAIDKGFKNLGLIATNYTVHSDVFREELAKISPDITFTQRATPLLVPLIENGGEQWVEDVLAHYLEPFKVAGVECLLLGCTHYSFLRKQIQSIMGDDVALLCQDEIVPVKLEGYLSHHPEYSDKISRNGAAQFYVSEYTEHYSAAAQTIYGAPIKIEEVEL